MDVTRWDERREAFAEAAGWFVRTAPLAAGREQEPGLGVWTVRDLLGHTSRSFLTVEAYLDSPATAVEVASPAEYFRRVSGFESAADPEAVAQRGRDAGRALGEDPAGAITAIAARVLDRVGTADPHAVIATLLGAMRLTDYLPTRTFELTIHTADLRAALGEEEEPPPGAARAALEVLSELAVGTGRAGALLRSATGRGPLPDGYSLL
ncbi:maleylpyruvate isomerase N-terminal domain-containing protein [Georgenia wangjunii]|uniref:maleylpyruvate isomerase N-terminal domain-containing protein n=1 Tax=Georgenia wangjunii TaxID=3117730 RepID=UPI002F26B466